jgi:HlyD family secretion protein
MQTRTWIISAAAAAVVLAGGGWWLAGRDDSQVTYRTARIERGSLQAAVAATGTVNPVSQVQVGTQVSGQVRELLVDFNSEVRQGQLIARIDPETFEYRLRQATADLEAARASVLTAQANVQQALAQASRAGVELQEAQRDLERKQGLVAQNFISPAEADTARAKAATLVEAYKATQAMVDVARAQVQAAQATVKQRDAQLAQARVDLERTQIRSPVDGIVIKRSVEAGQTVAASLQAPELFVIARNLSDMQVEASIDESDVARVRVGQPAGFTVDAFPGRSFEGQVRQVRKAAVNSQNVITYVAVVGFTNVSSQLLPGMTANVRIVTDTRDDVLKVPNAALRVRIAGLQPAAAPGPVGASAAGARPDGGPGGDPRAAPAFIASAHAQPADAAASTPRRRGALAGGPGGPGGGPGPGGPLRDFRERLITDLQLTPGQIDQVDAVMAEARPRFMALRDLPEDERAKARERILADLRARIGDQLPPPQRARYQHLVAELSSRQSTRGRIHLLGDDGQPRAFDVRLGITDGSMTELLVPRGAPDAGELQAGATVITGVAGAQPAAGQGGNRPAGPRMMF